MVCGDFDGEFEVVGDEKEDENREYHFFDFHWRYEKADGDENAVQPKVVEPILKKIAGGEGPVDEIPGIP